MDWNSLSRSDKQAKRLANVVSFKMGIAVGWEKHEEADSEQAWIYSKNLLYYRGRSCKRRREIYPFYDI